MGALVGVIGAVVMVIVALTSPSGSLFRSDALYFRLVAEHPFGNAHALATHVASAGDAYRYGRILYPLVAWILAVGNTGWVHWTLPVVDLAALVVLAAVAAELVARRGRPVERALVILLVPGVWLTVAIAFSEVFVLALVLVLYLAVVDGRSRVAPFVVGALALLARETAALAIAPLVLVALRDRRWRDVGAWALTVVPLVVWWAWVRHAVGQWPPLDPSVSRREALSYPLGGVIRVIHEGAHADHFAAWALGAATVAGAIYVFARARWFPITAGALLYGLLIVCFGPNAMRFSGEAIRLMAPAQALTLLALAARPAVRVSGRVG